MMKIKKFKDFSFLNYTLLFLSSILFGSVLETEPNKNSLIVNNNNIGLVHEKRLIKVMRKNKLLQAHHLIRIDIVA